MKRIEFDAACKQSKPADDFSPPEASLWYDKQGDWDTAHSIAQEIETRLGSAIHAYLHRKEGVMWNADYWYSRAGRMRPSVSLDQEWEQLVDETCQ